MNKLIAILLLCCFSTIFTVECFAHTMDNVNGLELYETDTEESEKELEDLKTVSVKTYNTLESISSELDILGCQNDRFRVRVKNYGEINTQPPELKRV